jgi:hypothetical protein
MDQAIVDFLNKGTFVLAALVVIANFFVRRIVELVRPDFRPLAGSMDHQAMYSNRLAMWWNEIGLYALPVFIGANLGLIKGLGFLFDASIKTPAGHVFYAAVVGWFADFLYEVVQKILYKNTGVALPNPRDLGSTTVVVSHTANDAGQASTETTVHVENTAPAVDIPTVKSGGAKH